jgi:hypothetical protein
LAIEPATTMAEGAQKVVAAVIARARGGAGDLSPAKQGKDRGAR